MTILAQIPKSQMQSPIHQLASHTRLNSVNQVLLTEGHGCWSNQITLRAQASSKAPKLPLQWEAMAN